MSKLEKMKQLNETLKEAAKAYYQESREIMSNYEYDKLYDELLKMEEELGIVLGDSVTQKVGYEIISELPKKKHPSKMLSLDKTKDRNSLVDWLNGKIGCLSFKLDGLTIVLHYKNGELIEAVTRGNGEIGEIITPNARFFKGVPKKIPFKGSLIVRGEALMTYENFEKVNAQIGDADSKYKNPRNLASGTIRQLDTKVTAERGIDFRAFTLVEAENFFEENLIFEGEMENGSHMGSYSEQLDWLESLGFQVVEHVKVTPETILDKISEWEKKLSTNLFPSDGLVLFYDDVYYGRLLGTTSKFPRNGIAFKWADETAITVVKNIEWSASRTGLLNPVAIFDSVELEGTTVSRASVHNVSVIKDLKLNVGDKVEVYKANMIIPQIARNLTQSLDDVKKVTPNHCPICAGKVNIVKQKDSEVLMCTNPDCLAKHVGKFEHFVSRDAMNIVGLSTSIIMKLINLGILEKFEDFYYLNEFEKAIVNLDGYGKKSYDNLIEAINKSKTIELPRFVYALGIPNVGLSTAKIIVKHFGNNLEALAKASKEELAEIDGVGDVLAQNISDYFSENYQEIFDLASKLSFTKPEVSTNNRCENLIFVITGSVEHFPNRNALKDFIEERGGKVSGSVSSKTNYLINNDKASNSGKNKKAKELGIEIISEDDFLNLFK